MIPRSVPALLLLAACSPVHTGAEPDSGLLDTDPGTVGSGGDDTAVDDCIPEPGPCPQGALEMGEAGAFHVDTVALSWNDRTEDCGVWVSEPVHLRRGSDVASYTLTIDGLRTWTAFGLLEIDGEPRIDVLAESGPTAFGHAPFYTSWMPAASVVLPNGPDTAPEGSCVAVVAVADADLDPDNGRLHVASRRYAQGDTLDLNLVVVDDTHVEDWELEAIAYYTQQAFDASGIELGDLQSFALDLGVDGYVASEGEDIDVLRSTLVEGREQAVNVFFVQDFIGESLYGIAGGVPGPVVHGTAASGVVVSVDTHLSADMQSLDTAEFGATVAHEIGHQLGLFHTSEADGSSHDVLPDTPECGPENDADDDGMLLPSECEGKGGDHVMFWTTDGTFQERWSEGQGDVLTTSPAVRR